MLTNIVGFNFTEIVNIYKPAPNPKKIIHIHANVSVSDNNNKYKEDMFSKIFEDLYKDLNKDLDSDTSDIPETEKIEKIEKIERYVKMDQDYFDIFNFVIEL